MKNLLSLRDLSLEEINRLLYEAEAIKNNEVAPQIDKIAANLFFEPSTRTHYSFVMAEIKLGMQYLDFNPSSSSLNKGESLRDTAQLFQSLGANCLIIRHSKDRYYDELADFIDIPIINAGDGKGDHPTQSLLDLLTIKEEFGKFTNLKCLIIGDIKFSRVANTNVEIFKRLGMEVYCLAPEALKTDGCTDIPLDELVPEMDVIMALRVQNERHNEKLEMSQNEYLQNYGITEAREQNMKDKAILMHPAPVNRDWEIQSSVVDGGKSRIFKQMTNGLYVRMAVLNHFLR